MKELTLLPEDTLASLSVYPGSDEARKMTATSGRRFAELLPRHDPAGSCVKMLLVTSRWVSTRCLMTWKVLDTPVRRRLCFQLVPSANGIGETESGLLPTTRASIYKNRKWWTRKRSYQNLEELAMRPGYEWLNGKPINPQWLEWHMGYPIGWTELEEPETPSCQN